ncbi:EAL domain-containing protein [Rhodoferax sp. GW822-FHT02A01]|uniref:putative bifunctional diguanylate cyclase/phosphodiesterase n=1 Tax=Rhodoferax sp. GW822-FHT02A01 TaxID=3141537 RepID=UPI00315D80F0
MMTTAMNEALPASRRHQNTRHAGSSMRTAERKRIERELRIAATAFEAHEGMMITDADKVILRVNRAFAESSGYTPEEVIGKTPQLFRSHCHGPAFYEELWREVDQKGYWRGEMVTRRKNGELFPVWYTMTGVRGSNGAITNYVTTSTDITRQKKAEKEIGELVFYDPLTKLGNRRLLMDRLQQALTGIRRSGNRGALFFIDLDNFKTLNDTAGHEVGDLLLQQVAKRLGTCIRDGDTVARLGGDEFVVILTDLNAQLEPAMHLARQVGERILETLNMPYELAGQVHLSSPSIGVVMFCKSNETVQELLRHADLAMYQAKAGGRNGLRFFDPAMQTAIKVRADLEAALRQALQRREFVLHYQPQINAEGKLVGAEALVRWQHPQRGLLSPGEFIGVAEESGMVVPLGLQVLEIACEQLVQWARSCTLCDFVLSVNVSARQFHQSEFVEQVLATLQRTGANPKRLKLELTESLLLDNVEDTITKMTTLRSHGVSFALDDFGIGYSSLSYLKRLPLDQLKIDQSFVRTVLSDANDAAIAKMIVALGQTMGLTVIAEGVETQEQRDFLLESGCIVYQGYYFGRPMPTEQFEAFLRNIECLEETSTLIHRCMQAGKPDGERSLRAA